MNRSFLPSLLATLPSSLSSPMPLSNQIAEDMKVAMKNKDNATLSTLRLLRSALKNKQIDVQHELSEEEVMAVVKSQLKQLQDSLDSFLAAGRQETVSQLKAEMAVLAGYLPAQMSDEALLEAVKVVIQQCGAVTKADMGKVMGLAMKAVQGQADGTRVKKVVETILK